MRFRHVKNTLCTSLVLLNLIYWYLFIFQEKCLNSIDDCMLDDTPCYPDIKKSLNLYFPNEEKRFPTLLTYHPTIDCDHGRYLLITEGSHTYHGTGSQLMWYLGILNVAYKLNLTLIHFNWTAEHSNDERNVDREKYWQFYDWQIPYSAYQSCPQNSSIKRNIFKYNLLENQTLDRRYKGKESFPISSHLKILFDRFTKKNPLGFTFHSIRTFTIVSSLIDVGIVMEIRWWLQHRKFYKHNHGVWSGISIPSNYFPIDYFPLIPSKNKPNRIECPSIDINDVLLIGVHIRQGDVVKRNNSSRITSVNLYRYIPNSANIPLIISIIKSLPVHLEKKYLITIYSEGVVDDFVDIMKALPQSRCRLSFFLNGRTSETFNRFVRDDILIYGSSTFSLASGIFNSRQLKIGPFHNRARVHGMRNHLTLFLTQNHSAFRITDEKVNLMKQRIKYVWEEKQRQRRTYHPLWLDNYRLNYPEEYMFI